MESTSPFEQAEIYVKDVLSIPIELAIKDLNKQLLNDKEVPGLKLIVTGGQAINTYFPQQPYLRTHDYDLKLIAPKNTNYTSTVRERMVLLAKGIVRYFAIILNRYTNRIFDKMSKDVKEKFDIQLLRDENDEMFVSSSNLRNELLNVVTFRMQNFEKIRTNSVADVYVVDPDEIYHYNTFTGLTPESNPILSEDSGDYYIPFQMVNEIPIAGMGYLIWDTLRMISWSEELGYVKLPKYKAKRDAILNSLNDPNAKLSCNSMKDYMLKCEKAYQSCNIKDKKFTSVTELLRYGISEGIIPPNQDVVNSIMKTFDIYYLCNSIKRMVD